MTVKHSLCALALAALCSLPVLGQEAAKPTGPAISTLVEGLDNPAGIAIQPETGTVFVSDSGAARIVKIVDGKIEPVVVEFKIDIYGRGPSTTSAPWGSSFWTRTPWLSVVVTSLMAKRCSTFLTLRT